ncbi:MAG: hypothetical protein AAFP99_11360, partial [Pseudomonadota bacterium]
MAEMRFGRTQRSAKCLLAGVATLALSIMPHNAYADTGAQLLNDWAAAGAASPVFDLSFGSANEVGNTVTVSDLKIALSFAGMAEFFAPFIGQDVSADGDSADPSLEYALSFPEVTFTNLRDTGTHISMDAVSADTLDLSFTGDQDVDATSVYSGVSGEALSFAKWPSVEPDTERPVSAIVPLFQAFLDVDAAILSVDRIETSARTAGEATMTQTYEAMVIEEAVDGNFGRVSVEEITIGGPRADTGAGSNAPEFLGTISQFTATDYNYGDILNAYLTDDVSTADTPYSTGIGSLEMTGMQFVVPEEPATFSIGRVAVENVGVRPGERNLLAMVDRFASAAIKGEPEPEGEEILSLVGTIYGNLSLGRFSIEDIAISTPNEASGVIGGFTIAGLSSAGMEEATLTGLNIVGPDSEVIRVGRWSMQGLTFPSLAAMMKLEEAADSGDIEAILEGLPTLARIEQNDILVVAPSEDLNMSIGSSIFEMLDHIGPIPTGIRMGFDGLRLDVANLDPADREPFEELGLDTVVVTSDSLLKWDRDTSDVNFDFVASVEQLGAIEGEATIGNVPAIVFEKPDQSSVFALLGATLKNVEINFDDEGIVERGINIAAREEGLSYDAMELRLKGVIPVLLSELDDVQLASKAADALTAVLENGAGLTLRAVAPTPLPIAAIASAAENPASLATLF